MSNSETRKCCPECESLNLYNRTSTPFGKRSTGDVDHKYRCRNCRATFDEPNHRDVERSHSTAKYAGLDAADVGLD